MCGINGVLSKFERPDQNRQIVSKMNELLRHRGPDDEGVSQSQGGIITLGHRRLSINDLSARGHQPMVSASGRYTIAYNGEIYNHRDIRKDLTSLGHRFDGTSDTEVLLASIEQWGIDSAIAKCVGMFAFGIWDSKNEILTIVRDRMGEKPLYYGIVDEDFVFSSELKPFLCHPRWKGTIDQFALSQFLKFNYVPSPLSIFEGIFKLLPGHKVEISRHLLHKKSVKIKAYWSLNTKFDADENLADAEVINSVRSKIIRSVSDQMVADVPVGCFLSGGIDSSVVAAVMQSLSERPISTFSIGFSEKEYNEADYAVAVAKQIKSDHHDMYVSAADCQNVIPILPSIYDEPFADSSQIPTFLVSQLARKTVKVSLSGDAGDELFGGYYRHLFAEKYWKHMDKLPKFFLTRAAAALNGKPAYGLSSLVNKLLPPERRVSNIKEKLAKLSHILTAETDDQLYSYLTENQIKQDFLKQKTNGQIAENETWSGYLRASDGAIRMMAMDASTYLPDDILTKVDRASMAVSLESRIPFLDYRLVEYAFSLPMKYKIRNGKTKWVLREILKQYLPGNLINRPKMGFAVPISEWLRSSLRDWATDLLFDASISADGFLNGHEIQKLLLEHLSGKKNNACLLWGILMFQSWIKNWKGLQVSKATENPIYISSSRTLA